MIVIEDRGYEKAAYLYDLFDTKENINFFLHYSREFGEVLDIGAGTGRIAVPLAEKGVRVTCIEPSFAMRREFKRKLTQHPELSDRIEMHEDDAASFDLKKTFHTAILSGVFDHFLDDRERLTSLTNIRKHLRSDGKLVFDLFPGLMESSPLVPAGNVIKGDREYKRFVGRSVLPSQKIELLLVYEIHESGKLVERIEQHSLAGIIDRTGVHRLLAESGFEPAKEFGDYNFSEYRQGDSLLVVEAVRED